MWQVCGHIGSIFNKGKNFVCRQAKSLVKYDLLKNGESAIFCMESHRAQDRLISSVNVGNQSLG
jgi:hypothetical protein